MYNSDHLKNLCNTNNSLSELYGIKIDKVEPKTVRTKGQFSLERFFYMREGKQKFTLKNGETIIAQKGDIIYLPPDITYVSEWETNPDLLMAETERAQERLRNQMDTCRLLEYCRPEEGRGSQKGRAVCEKKK